MSINKNDCMDCDCSIKLNHIDNNREWWVCNKGNIIPQDKNGIVNVLDEDCEDFVYSI